MNCKKIPYECFEQGHHFEYRLSKIHISFAAKLFSRLTFVFYEP